VFFRERGNQEEKPVFLAAAMRLDIGLKVNTGLIISSCTGTSLIVRLRISDTWSGFLCLRCINRNRDVAAILTSSFDPPWQILEFSQK